MSGNCLRCDTNKHSESCVQCSTDALGSARLFQKHPWVHWYPTRKRSKSCRHCFQKTSLGALGPNKDEKQVMLQLPVTMRSCRGSLCYGTVHGQVGKSVCRTLGTQALVCDVPVLAFCGVATDFGPLLKNLLHSGHVHCSTVNATGAPERPHSSASSSKSSLGIVPPAFGSGTCQHCLPFAQAQNHVRHPRQSSKESPRSASCPNSLTAMARGSHNTRDDH